MKYKTQADLWNRLKEIWKIGGTYNSLALGNEYKMLSYDDLTQTCIFLYESGKEKPIPFREVWAMYKELHDRGNLPRDFMRDPQNAFRLTGKKSWGAPGAAMYALLPVLDSNIKWDGRKLYV